MNAKYAVMAILKADSTFGAIVGEQSGARIYYNEVEQTAQTPFAVIKEDEIQPNDTKSGPSTLDEDFVYVTHFAPSEQVAGQMASACRTALDRVTGIFGGVTICGSQFRTQRSDTEKLTNKKTITIEQLYKIMVQQ